MSESYERDGQGLLLKSLTPPSSRLPSLIFTLYKESSSVADVTKTGITAEDPHYREGNKLAQLNEHPNTGAKRFHILWVTIVSDPLTSIFSLIAYA